MTNPTDIVEEAKKWIDTDHILCGDGYEQAENIIPDLLTTIEDLQNKLTVAENFIDDSFVAHPNLDLDIELTKEYEAQK